MEVAAVSRVAKPGPPEGGLGNRTGLRHRLRGERVTGHEWVVERRHRIRTVTGAHHPKDLRSGVLPDDPVEVRKSRTVWKTLLAPSCL